MNAVYATLNFGKDLIIIYLEKVVKSVNKTHLKIIIIEKKPIELLIKQSQEIFGDTILFDKVIYKNGSTSVIFICRAHGDFEQTPEKHLEGHIGCKKCLGKKYENLFTINLFNKFRNKIILTGNYKNLETSALFNCCNHGEFTMKPENLLESTFGCPKCYQDSIIRKPKEIKIPFNKELDLQKREDNFLERSLIKNKSLVTYYFVKYLGKEIPVELLCNRCYNIFWQKPHDHLKGTGCPLCSKGKSERQLFENLKSYYKDYEILNSAKPDWLNFNKGRGHQHLDIYFPELNIAIEYQGKQHFEAVDKFGGKEGFITNQGRDERKRNFCLENNCELFYFTYKIYDIPKDYPFKVYTDEEELIDNIDYSILNSKVFLL